MQVGLLYIKDVKMYYIYLSHQWINMSKSSPPHKISDKSTRDLTVWTTPLIIQTLWQYAVNICLWWRPNLITIQGPLIDQMDGTRKSNKWGKLWQTTSLTCPIDSSDPLPHLTHTHIWPNPTSDYDPPQCRTHSSSTVRPMMIPLC